PLLVIDAPFDVDPVALFAILLHDVGETCALGVPDDAPVPLGLLLLLTIRRIPRTARSERKARDSVATRRRSDFRIAAKISDQHHFIQTSTHCASWREFVPAQNSIGVAQSTSKPTISTVSKTAHSFLRIAFDNLDELSKHQRVFDRPPVILRPSPNLAEAARLVEGQR